MPMTSHSLFLLMLLVICNAGCEPETHERGGSHYGSTSTEQIKPILRLAVHPLHNPNKLTEVYQPLIDYLNRQIAMFTSSWKPRATIKPTKQNSAPASRNFYCRILGILSKP